ncbi:MAG: delta-60 repeat domain-containing protein, partial [Verrucomicrobiota bacterium]
WIGFNSSATPIRVTPIAASIATERPAPEPKTRKGLTVVPMPVPVAAHVADPEKTVEIPLAIPEAVKLPAKKILILAGGAFVGLIILAAVGWLIGKLVFSNGVPPITSLPDGSALLDPTFQTKTIIDNFIRTIAVQADGKIVLGGGFEIVDGIESKHIARLNADGTFDKNFAASLNNVLYSVVIAPSDGKILLGGDFTDVSGQVCKSIARLASDGSVDPEFHRWTDTEGSLRSISVQTDRKIIIAGSFKLIQGAKKNHIARLNSDGSLDENFKGEANGVIWPVTFQSDDKILIGGDFNAVDGVKRHRIARLNSDGHVDKDFNPGGGANGWVYAIAVQNDGRIVIGGDFTEFSGRPRNRVARLESDGSLDATFTPGAGPDNGIRSVVIQGDQKILLGGVFKYFNDVPLNHIARLNFNGSVDTSFDSGTGFNEVVRALALQKDGKILVAGHFTNYNGMACNRIARLRGASVKTKK